MDDMPPGEEAQRRAGERSKWSAAVLPGRVIVIEIVCLAGWFVIYTRLHNLGGHDVAVATRNALSLQSQERDAHLDIALAANQWLGQHPALIRPAVLVYRGYYVVLVAVVLWIALRHGDLYPRLRRSLVAMTALVLPVWWLLPMSPPRFALDGVVDIVARNDLFGSGASTALNNGQNSLSAMPSMHVAFAAWCAYAVWSCLRRSHPRATWLAWLFPALMVAVVLVTGNHYVLDIVGSAVLLALAVAIAQRVTWASITAKPQRGSQPET